MSDTRQTRFPALIPGSTKGPPTQWNFERTIHLMTHFFHVTPAVESSFVAIYPRMATPKHAEISCFILQRGDPVRRQHNGSCNPPFSVGGLYFSDVIHVPQSCRHVT